MEREKKVLHLLCYLQMWKFFSHYGMRSILVLNMVQELHFSEMHAFSVNSLFLCLFELGALFGGLIADRILGLSRSLIVGSCLLTVGYISLFFSQALYGSLLLLIGGASLFSSNLTALLSQVYKEGIPQREKGFTRLYVWQNLGALLATSICGGVATCWGFPAGFLAASTGMLIGTLQLIGRKKILLGLDPEKSAPKPLLTILVGLLFLILASMIRYADLLTPILPFLACGFMIGTYCYLSKQTIAEPRCLRRLMASLGGLILFFAAEDQMFSSLLVFVERETSHTLFGIPVPSATFIILNPLLILFLGNRLGKKQETPLIPLLLVALIFGTLALICGLGLRIPLAALMVLIAFLTIAELKVGPSVLCLTSEVATRGSPGVVMALMPMGYALSALLGGGLSQWVAIPQGNNTLHSFGQGFGKIALLLLAGALFLHLLTRRKQDEKYSVC